MRKLGMKGIALLSGTMILATAGLALACTTKSATVVGRVSMASAPAGSACAASGESCVLFEVMSATNADGLALGDLTGKTMKASYAKDATMPASWTKDAIYVATANVDWENGVLRLAKVESANEAVAAAAIASWQKSGAVAMNAGSGAGMCAASAKASCGAKADGATASSKGSCAAKADAATASSGAGCCASKADAASASSKGSCASKTDGATASSKGSCASKTDGATASSKGSCGAKSEAAAAAARALTFNVSGMTCKGCVTKVEAALLAVKGVANATVDLEKNNATVGVAEGVNADEIVKAIEGAGFKAEIASAEAPAAPAKG